jgi:hypothetical protein
MAFDKTVNITTLQKVTLNAEAIDCCGIDYVISGIPLWTNTDDSVATISAATDGLTCEVTSVVSGFTDVIVDYDGKSYTTRVVVGGPVLNYIRTRDDMPVLK